MKYTVMHTGYPVAGRAIQPDEWKELSTHRTESAAMKAVKKARAHLDYGQWDDHYKVVDSNGNECDISRYWERKNWERTSRW